MYFTVLDLKDTFFNISISPESQDLFALTRHSSLGHFGPRVLGIAPTSLDQLWYQISPTPPFQIVPLSNPWMTASAALLGLLLLLTPSPSSPSKTTKIIVSLSKAHLHQQSVPYLGFLLTPGNSPCRPAWSPALKPTSSVAYPPLGRGTAPSCTCFLTNTFPTHQPSHP